METLCAHSMRRARLWNGKLRAAVKGFLTRSRYPHSAQHGRASAFLRRKSIYKSDLSIYNIMQLQKMHFYSAASRAFPRCNKKIKTGSAYCERKKPVFLPFAPVPWNAFTQRRIKTARRRHAGAIFTDAPPWSNYICFRKFFLHFLLDSAYKKLLLNSREALI